MLQLRLSSFLYLFTLFNCVCYSQFALGPLLCPESVLRCSTPRPRTGSSARSMGSTTTFKPPTPRSWTSRFFETVHIELDYSIGDGFKQPCSLKNITYEGKDYLDSIQLCYNLVMSLDVLLKCCLRYIYQ